MISPSKETENEVDVESIEDNAAAVENTQSMFIVHQYQIKKHDKHLQVDVLQNRGRFSTSNLIVQTFVRLVQYVVFR